MNPTNTEDRYVAVMTELAAKAELLTPVIESYLPDAATDRYAAPVIEAMRYAVASGGKRLRPVIMREVYLMLCGDAEPEMTAANPASLIVSPFMAALEFIHSYSLVHDDLPCMDDDMYRRGQLTVHARFGEAAAVLAGDALLNLAYEVMAAAVVSHQYDECLPDLLNAQYIISYNAGIRGMVGGQAADISSGNTAKVDMPSGNTAKADITSGKTAKKAGDESAGAALPGRAATAQDPDRAEIELIAYIDGHKTGALFGAAWAAGAALAGAPADDLDDYVNIGQYMGTVFQITDDLIDDDPEAHTFARAVGAEAARYEAASLTEAALSLLASKPANAHRAFLSDLIQALLCRQS